MIIEQYHSNHLIPISALYNFWLPSYKDFGGYTPSTFFCDFSLIFIILSIFENSKSGCLCVLPRDFRTLFDTNFSFLELFVIEIVAVLLVYPLRLQVLLNI